MTTPTRPIVVLADDLTGAAELAGAAHRHGLSAEVLTDWDTVTLNPIAAQPPDVLCLDTNTRSLPSPRAANTVATALRAVLAALPDGPAWIYKKCDSVLRGSVLLEIRAIQAVTRLPHATLVPANPRRGRVIRDGLYFVGDQPLHETDFARDPEHPRLTHRVAQLLSGDLPHPEITTPDATSPEDLARHASGLHPEQLAAGGVEFFEAVLQARTGARPTVSPPSSDAARAATGPTLFVCGSAAAWQRGRAEEAQGHSVPVFPMPLAVAAMSPESTRPATPPSPAPADDGEVGDEDDTAVDGDPSSTFTAALATWSRTLAHALRQGQSVMAAIGQPPIPDSVAPAVLADRLAQAVAAILQSRQGPTAVRLCLEGGATAAAVARAMRWTRFSLRAELAGGVVALTPVPSEPAPHPTPEFVIKVGSYDWPEDVWPRPHADQPTSALSSPPIASSIDSPARGANRSSSTDQPNVAVHATPEQANLAAAECLASWLAAPETRRVMLAAGGTPLELYRLIGERGLSLGHLEVFALDEYVGVPRKDPRTCANLIRRVAIDPWGVPAGQFFTISPDPREAAGSIASHERVIESGGGLDILVLGLGQNGHLGFNEPGSAENSGARVLDLAPSSVEANRQWFSGDHAPAQGATIGLRTLLAARCILLLAYGPHKRAAVHAMLHGPRSTDCPASLLRGHPNVHIFLDAASSASPSSPSSPSQA